MNQTWEYKVQNFYPQRLAKLEGTLSQTDMEQILNEYGEKGWELTGVTEYGTPSVTRIFLKRQKQ